MIKSPTYPENPVPIHEFLSQCQAGAGLSDEAFAAALGFTQNSVKIIGMIKAGTLALPLGKVGLAAEVLGISKGPLLRRVLEERCPALWALVDDLIDSKRVTDNEFAYLEFLRAELGSADICLTKVPELTTALQPVLAALREQAGGKQ